MGAGEARVTRSDSSRKSRAPAYQLPNLNPTFGETIPMGTPRKHFFLKLESFEGRDTHVRCGDDEDLQDFIYCVIVTNADGTAEIVDSGYRSAEELLEAWPELAPKI